MLFIFKRIVMNGEGELYHLIVSSKPLLSSSKATYRIAANLQCLVRHSCCFVPSTGIEPIFLAPEANALSVELRGHIPYYNRFSGLTQGSEQSKSQRLGLSQLSEKIYAL
jgi:hypothetical protein